VLGRRADGYHELDTIAVFADVGDHVAVFAADDVTLSVSGPFAAHAPAGPDNLVLRAARLLRECMHIRSGAAIRLEKNLPAGAGFGGGSADAAATLHALNGLWRLGLGLDRLISIGGGLGADVAMCLHSVALRARGTGERIAPIRGWPPLPLVLVWPDEPLSTVSVFAALAGRVGTPLPKPMPAATPAEVAVWLSTCRNDLEEAALRLAPEIGDALAALRASKGCLLARMSGSGSGCFGIYDSLTDAEAAAKNIQNAKRDWWVAACEAR
jgi:4-diphosphocytidyl-2-C-methyl-D-erythritol kinase